ncbi:MAG: hypothetical protein Q4A24_00360 [Akkermansia sp.]|nr:hypothetical protein [Akkermansia sp.]
MEWNNSFMTLFRNAVERFHERPQTAADRFFLPEECSFLADIGYTPEEMHAYIADYATKGDPSPSTILLIAAARRSFFITSQRGIFGNAKPVKESDLPAETDDFQGIPYLPRIIRKAEAKLHGTLDAELMYYCEKDRAFLRSHGNIHPADFLHLTWAAHGDKQKMVSSVLNAIRDAQPSQQPESPQKSPGREPASDTSGTAVQSELKLD